MISKRKRSTKWPVFNKERISGNESIAMRVTKVKGFASVRMYASMQASTAQSRDAAARLHRRLQHPPLFALGFSLAAVSPLACLTSRPAALRDAPRYFTFKIIRNHCKNLCNNKKILLFKNGCNKSLHKVFFRNFSKIKCLCNFQCTPRCMSRARRYENPVLAVTLTSRGAAISVSATN